MKKLIAVICCLAVAAVFTYAKPNANLNAKAEQAVNGQLRVLTLEVWPTVSPKDAFSGKAVIVGFSNNFTRMTLLLSESMTTDVDILEEGGELSWLGQVTKGFVQPEKAFETKFMGFNTNKKRYYKVTVAVELKGSSLHNARQMKNISLQEAAKLL